MVEFVARRQTARQKDWQISLVKNQVLSEFTGTIWAILSSQLVVRIVPP